MTVTEEAVRQSALVDGEADHKKWYSVSRRTKMKIGGIAFAGLAAAGGVYTVFHKLAVGRESRINTNLETRLHDYGFPFDTAQDPIGKIDVYGHGKKIDIRCGKAAEQVIGFYVRNDGPHDIELYLPVNDLHGNPIDQVRWPVGGSEEVQSFLHNGLPKNCGLIIKATTPKQ